MEDRAINILFSNFKWIKTYLFNICNIEIPLVHDWEYKNDEIGVSSFRD